MKNKNKWYLFLSTIVFLLTLVAIFQNFETINIIGFETEVIWLPIWIAVVILPLLNVYEIAVNIEESNTYYWLALVFNLVTIFFIIRYFKIQLLS